MVFGNSIAKEIYNPLIYILFWIVYTITILTICNTLFNLYTYLTINKKQSAPGDKGPPGPDGDEGPPGQCKTNCKIKKYIDKVINNLEKYYNLKLKNQESRKINNKFIKETVTRILESRQFKEISQSQSVEELIKYLTEIFKRWFDILYEADKSENKKHFRDYMEIYGEIVKWEFITNPKNNPFAEIEKYDVYYWGLDKEFYPIPLDKCKIKTEKESIKVVKTNLYRKLYDDSGSKASRDLSVWISNPVSLNNETFYPLGSVVANTHNPSSNNRYISLVDNESNKFKNDMNIPGKGPDFGNILIATNDNNLVRRPPAKAWSWKWNNYRKFNNALDVRRYRYKDSKVTFWNAKDFEEDGEKFKCFGSMVMNNHNYEQTPTQQLGRNNIPFVCVNEKILEEIPNKHNDIWNDSGTGAENDGGARANMDGDYNLAYFTKGYLPEYSRKSYKIKNSFIKNDNKKVYTTDYLKNNASNVGFQTPKYERQRSNGLFDLLDLVVESDIESFNNGSKLHIQHSGLNEVNSYLIKKKLTGNKAGDCLQIVENNINIAKCNPTKISQLWEVEFLGQSSELCLIRSKDNNKYLSSKILNNFRISSNISSKEINDPRLKPFIWKIISSK